MQAVFKLEKGLGDLVLIHVCGMQPRATPLSLPLLPPEGYSTDCFDLWLWVLWLSPISLLLLLLLLLLSPFLLLLPFPCSSIFS